MATASSTEVPPNFMTIIFSGSKLLAVGYRLSALSNPHSTVKNS
jgi:hypothetical protein